MLRSTRPLFAQHVLNAILKEQNMSCNKGKLTAEVLLTAKTQIIQNKLKFTTLGGLFGQMAILHSKFISNTVDELLKAKKGDARFLGMQRQSCIRHHFGMMRLENPGIQILSLYLAPKFIYTRRTGGEDYEKDRFKPNIVFESPSNDPLLYLICVRNGLYWTDDEDKTVRISSSYALLKLLK